MNVGKLIPRKGLNYLIEAFHKAALPDDAWELDIVGDGPERERLQGMVADYGLAENIKLLGAKDRMGVIDALRNSDVFVLSSLSETFGVVVIEALACGLPVIATDCGGARDFLTKENGLICPVNDVNKLAEAILHMYRCRQDYDKKKIAEDCKRRFSSEAIGKQLEGIFEEIIRKSKQ